MSGWLVVRAEGVRPGHGGVWARALATIPEDCVVEEWSEGEGRLSAATWRRASGEFRYSGTLTRDGASGVRVAWVGACLEDDGEATEHAIRSLGGDDAGPKSPESWNGAFAAAVLDGRVGSLEVCTDRHAHYPVYTWSGDGIFVASTDLGGLMPFVPRPAPDLGALDLFLRCGEFIDDLSHIRGVAVLPGGTRVRVGPGGNPTRTRYWLLHHGAGPSVGPVEAVDELAVRLTAAVRRVEHSYPRLVVPLSGGLDSRILLGLCRDPRQVPSATWGTTGCRDLRYAAAFARRVGSPHSAYEFDPDAYPPLWEQGAAITGGGVPVRDMYFLPFVQVLADQADTMLNGLAGDAVLGGNFSMRALTKLRSLDLLASASWRWRVRPDEEEWADRLMLDSEARGVGRGVWERSILATEGSGPREQLFDWLIENRVFRFTNGGTQIARTALESSAPFFDRDFLDLIVRVPLSARHRHRLYLKVLRRACPAAASVPWQRTAIPPGWGHPAQVASLAVHRGLKMAGKPLGIDPFPAQSAASPAEWFRGPWHAPTREILLSERTLDRGVFRPDALRGVLAAHLQGDDLSRTLGSLLATELFYRRFLDRDHSRPRSGTT